MRALLLFVAWPALMCACGQNPGEVARDYLANLKRGRYQVCYQMLSARDKLAQTPEQFAANMPLAPDANRAWFEAVEAVTQYELDPDARVHGLKALVEVTVTTVDLPLWERAIEKAYGPPAAARAARDSLKRGAYPRFSYGDELVLIKETRRWRVYADLAGRERIARLHRAALRLYHEHRFAQAQQSYDDLLAALNKPQASGARGAIARYSRERALAHAAGARSAEARRYLGVLRLANVTRRMTDSGDAGMVGQITNGGDKPVDEVRVRVSYFLGADARRSPAFVAEHAAIANPIEFTGFLAPATPLMPGETRSFGLRLSASTSIQEDAAPNLVLSSVVFPPWSARALSGALAIAGTRAPREDNASRAATASRTASR